VNDDAIVCATSVGAGQIAAADDVLSVAIQAGDAAVCLDGGVEVKNRKKGN